MPMNPSDRILGPPRGTAANTIAFATSNGAARLDDVAAYVREDYRLSPLVGIDPAIVVAQSVHETTLDGRPWASSWWVERLNPAGMGITGDPAEDNASRTWTNGAASAQSQIAHLLVYALGPTDAGRVWLEKSGTGVSIATADPRYYDYVAAYGNTAQATTIADLAGKWAVDDDYALGIVEKAAAIYPNLPDQENATVPTGPVVFGQMPHPPYVARDIPSSINTAWDDLGPRTIRAICWHRSQGTHKGNDSYFRGEGRTRALTDYGIGVAAVDGAVLAGSIYRWNDPKGNRSPWANGQYDGAYGDGLAFGERYGVAAVNRDVTSVEISGFYPVPGEETRNTPLDPASREAIAALTAYWADRYRVSWETFPLIPAEGNRSFVIWHQEFTLGTGKTCPGPVVMSETDALIARAKSIMQRWQAVTPTTPPPAPPSLALPPGMSRGLAERLFNPVGVDHPATGTPAAFGIEERVSGEWLRRCMATIPAGKSWDSGTWPALASITKRGDGRLVWQFSNGSIVQEAPS